MSFIKLFVRWPTSFVFVQMTENRSVLVDYLSSREIWRFPPFSLVVDGFRYSRDLVKELSESSEGLALGRTVALTCVLTHFHSDHYTGLTGQWRYGHIFCTEATASLVESQLGLEAHRVHALCLNVSYCIDLATNTAVRLPAGKLTAPSAPHLVHLVLVDANHCPGAAMVVARFSTGEPCLHTGDFRFDGEGGTIGRNPFVQQVRGALSRLFLDNTYCDPKYSFPTQSEVFHTSGAILKAACATAEGVLIVCGSYFIGKERLAFHLAASLSVPLVVSEEKRLVLRQIGQSDVDIITPSDDSLPFAVREVGGRQVKVCVALASMSVFNYSEVASWAESDEILLWKRFKLGSAVDIVGFEPTGWAHSRPQSRKVKHLPPRTTIYSVPYSEHSSFLELLSFVQYMSPLKVIPTVSLRAWTYQEHRFVEKCPRLRSRFSNVQPITKFLRKRPRSSSPHSAIAVSSSSDSVVAL